MWRGLGSISVLVLRRGPWTQTFEYTDLEQLVILNVAATLFGLSLLKLLQTILIFQWRKSLSVFSSNIVLLNLQQEIVL
jgi:hypothetical protein